MADTPNTPNAPATGSTAACNNNQNDTPVIPPKSASGTARVVLVSVFAVLSVLLFYCLFVFWPSNSAITCLEVSLFGCNVKLYQEQQYFLLVVFGGALGAALQVILSATTFIGNGKLVDRWVPWYYLRPFIGAGLALIFYLLIRGGLLTYTPNNDNSSKSPSQNNVPTTDTVQMLTNAGDSARTIVAQIGYTDAVDSTSKTDSIKQVIYAALKAAAKGDANPPKQIPVNPFGIIAVACLAGLFSNEASNKLKKVFKALFTGDDNEDGLESKKKPETPGGNTPSIGQGTGGGTQTTPTGGGAQTPALEGAVNTQTSTTTTTPASQGQGSGTQSTTPDGGTQSGQTEGNNTQPGTPATGV